MRTVPLQDDPVKRVGDNCATGSYGHVCVDLLSCILYGADLSVRETARVGPSWRNYASLRYVLVVQDVTTLLLFALDSEWTALRCVAGAQSIAFFSLSLSLSLSCSLALLLVFDSICLFF